MSYLLPRVTGPCFSPWRGRDAHSCASRPGSGPPKKSTLQGHPLQLLNAFSKSVRFHPGSWLATATPLFFFWVTQDCLADGKHHISDFSCTTRKI